MVQNEGSDEAQATPSISLPVMEDEAVVKEPIANLLHCSNRGVCGIKW